MKKIIALILVVVMAFCFTACAKPVDKSQTDKEYIQGKGTLIVGITDYPPMDYKDESGSWIGFDAEMAAAFAKSLGVKAEFVEIDWDNKILELEAKSIDCVWNGMTLIDEVLNAMECSNAYCDNAQVVVVPASEADKYKDEDSVKGLTFAVESGSAGEKAVKELGYEHVSVQNQAAAVMEVAAGTSDACVIDLLMAGAVIGEGTSYPDLAHTVALNSEKFGVGFRKGSDLAKALNEFFAKAYADGSMMECAKTYGVQESILAQ